MDISIIIPTYNESANISFLIRNLQQDHSGLIKEIIVSDGGSTDETLQIAADLRVQAIRSPVRGRAAQMNYGASMANGDILYFTR
jgi:glycosyltransferase involved in cell wall biosynthesis